MSGLTKIHNKTWFHIVNKYFSLKHLSSFIPAFLVLYVLSLFSLIFLTTPQRYASAGPTPPPTPTLSTSVSSPNVNFQFSQSELISSAFKDSSVSVSVDTNNKTGATSYISSIDEDTNLNHTDPAVTEKISSITSPLLSSAFAQKSWGYHVIDGLNNTFKPVPKASTPDTISVTNSPSGSPYSIGIDFGVKSSPDLPSGNYSKQILFTTITNRVPNKAKFMTGGGFVKEFNSVVDTSATPIDYFKHSTTPPANFATTRIVSAADSERPIYIWYNSADKTVYWWSDADNVYANEDASFMFNSLYINQLADLRGINFSKAKNMNSMFAAAKTGGCIKKVNFDGFDTSNVEDMGSMFESFCLYDSISQDAVAGVSNFNTSKVKNMSGMFDGSKIKKLDLSSWDTKNVTNMSKMFNHTDALTELNVNNFDTSKVTNMSQMFAYASNLTSLDVTSFNTSHVTDMSDMFSCMGKLSSLDLSNFDTSKVTNMSHMFTEDKSIINLDLSSFNTSNVTNMSYMFNEMEKLQNLNLSSFNTANVWNMSGMFASAMTNPGNSTLDLSTFNTPSLTSAYAMFFDSKVKTIYASVNFDTTHIPNYNQLFKDNTNLVGGNGTTFSSSNPTDKTYARIDAPGTPGYFTKKL